MLSCAEAVELEKEVLRGAPEAEWEAMLRAGKGIADGILDDYQEGADWPDHWRMLIVAGKGHNAGDAFLAAREMAAAGGGGSVEVVFVFGEEALSPLAKRAWNSLLGATGPGLRIRTLSLDREGEVVAQLEGFSGKRYHLCLDGLFGMNFRPPFRAPVDEVIDWLNQRLRADFRAAVDLPSGLSDEPAERAFRADFTYMTGSAKRPAFEPRNAEWAGRLRYLDLGFFERAPARFAEAGRAVLSSDVLDGLRGWRRPMTHKRNYGHLLVAGGSRRMPGAILMSILAAARSGVGLLTAAVPESLVPSFATVVPEAMWIGCSETEAGGLALDGLHRLENILPKATAVLIGPGVGTEQETQAMLEELAEKIEVPLVIDAEALQVTLVERLRRRPEMRGKVAVTPHAGEFARISGRDFAEEGEESLYQFCRDTGFLTLLKGPPFTRLCDGGMICYGLAGGPVLSRGGSGDLLAGIAGSLVARTPDDLGLAMRRAIVWHGLAAEALARESGQEAVRTTDLLDYLSRVLRRGGRTG